MPLYEYVCRDCDHEVEVLVRTPSEQAECPDCGGVELTKLLSVPSALSSGEGPSTGCCGSGCGCSSGG
ncbi:Zinc ribbon domain protein [Planctomycetes bacterium MalM25]|nr:Zinc ribbon domain protein [Planctomycetes bacterium MalM25]